MAVSLLFQHTAARRRLGSQSRPISGQYVVSTHSRPKAAGPRLKGEVFHFSQFQHTAARRRLG